MGVFRKGRMSKPATRIRDRADAEAMAKQGVVDPLFPQLLPPKSAVWILFGREPAQLDRFMQPARRTRRPRPPLTPSVRRPSGVHP